MVCRVLFMIYLRVVKHYCLDRVKMKGKTKTTFPQWTILKTNKSFKLKTTNNITLIEGLRHLNKFKELLNTYLH